jgi:anti-sigma B factor antagonist
MEEVKPRISVFYAQNATVVTLADEKILDDEAIRALEDSVMPLIEQAVNLVIDFSNVRFLSSAVLGLLIRITKRVNESKGRLKLCSISPQIFDVFRITRLDEIFEIYPDVKKAMQTLK